MKRMAVCFLLLLAVLSVASCAREAGRSRFKIDGLDDLLRALDRAGAHVAETALLGQPAFKTPAAILQVNQSIVHIYEYENQELRETISSALAPDGSAVGDTPLAWSGRVNIWVVGRLIIVYPGTDGGTILLLSGLVGDPIDRPEGVLDEPYPPALTAAIELLANSLAIDPGAVEVLSFQAVIWPDSCLGLPEQDERCQHEENSGYRIHLRAVGAVYEVRSDTTGLNLRLK